MAKKLWLNDAGKLIRLPSGLLMYSEECCCCEFGGFCDGSPCSKIITSADITVSGFSNANCAGGSVDCTDANGTWHVENDGAGSECTGSEVFPISGLFCQSTSTNVFVNITWEVSYSHSSNRLILIARAGIGEGGNNCAIRARYRKEIPLAEIAECDVGEWDCPSLLNGTVPLDAVLVNQCFPNTPPCSAGEMSIVLNTD